MERHRQLEFHSPVNIADLIHKDLRFEYNNRSVLALWSEGKLMPLYVWQEPYISASLETDDAKVYGRILEVRSAFEQRLLSAVGDEELRALGVAAVALDTLERKHPNIARRISDIRRGNPCARDLDI
jgi:hypothetical protein